mgnify:FL=1
MLLNQTLKAKGEAMMVQRSVILLLVMMIVFVGCGEDGPEKVKPKEEEGPDESFVELPYQHRK